MQMEKSVFWSKVKTLRSESELLDRSIDMVIRDGNRDTKVSKFWVHVYMESIMRGGGGVKTTMEVA